MTQALEKKYYTPEEYLALEETAEYKSEYYQGDIFQMAGGMPNHNSIAANAIVTLGSALKGKPCRTFNSDQRIFVAKLKFYTYPDVSVSCGPIELAPGRRDTIINPVLIVEVLSDSTEKYDRTTKFGFYKGLQSFQIYILIDQNRVYLECYQKNQAGDWVYTAYDKLSDTVELSALKIEISLADIYDKVEFEVSKPEQPLNDESSGIL